jgi:hypothetical protein
MTAMTRAFVRSLLAGAAGLCIGAGAAEAQQIHVKVVTSRDRPVSGAEVTLGFTTRRTDSGGALSMQVPRRGDYQLSIRWNGDLYFCDVETGRFENPCVVGR